MGSFAVIHGRICRVVRRNLGSSFACTPTKKPAPRVSTQGNRLYKCSQPVSGTAQMRYISRNRTPAAHRTFLKNNHKHRFDRLGEQILSEYQPPASDSRAQWYITSCVLPWLTSMTTPCTPTSQKSAQRLIKTTNIQYNLTLQ